MASIPRPPQHLKKAGRALWRRLLEEYAIDDGHGLTLLQSACESLDRMKMAEAEIDRLGVVIENKRSGAVKANPACCIERDARTQLMQALKALRLDVEIVPGKPGRPPGS